MPPRRRRKGVTGKISAETKKVHEKAPASSETKQSTEKVKSRLSSRISRTKAPKNFEEEASRNCCDGESGNAGKNVSRKRMRRENVTITKTDVKKGNCAVDSDASDFARQNCLLSTSQSGEGAKELRIVLKKSDICSPKKKVKVENGVCDSMSSSESDLGNVSDGAKGIFEECDYSARMAKRGRPKNFKQEMANNGKVGEGVKNVSRKRTKATCSTPNAQHGRSSGHTNSNETSGEKCPSGSSDSGTSVVKVETPTCSYVTREVDMSYPCSSGSSPQELKAVLKQDDSSPSTSKALKRGHQEEVADSVSSSESEWEEVEDHDEPSLDDYKPDIPKEGVEITLENPIFKKRYKKKKFDVDGFIRLQINRFKKDVQLALHKVHLLCLLGHGLYLNEMLSSCEIRALALSLLPSELINVTKNQNKMDIVIISKVVEWFCCTFTIDANLKPPSTNSLLQKLVLSFETQKTIDPSQLNIIFIAVARTLGINVRLCYSLYPLNFKPRDLLKKPRSKCAQENSSEGDVSGQLKEHKEDLDKASVKPQLSTKNSKQQKNSSKKGNYSKHFTIHDSAGTKEATRKNRSQKQSTKVQKKESRSETKAAVNQSQLSNVKKRPRRSKQNKSYKISSDENEDYDDSDADKDFVGSDGDADSDDEDANFVAGDESDGDYVKTIVVPLPQKRKNSCEKKQILKSVERSSKCSRKNTNGKERNRKILSSDSEDSSNQSGEEHVSSGIEFWSEVYSKSEKRWIPIETSAKLIDKPYEIEALARQPVSYVVAFDNKSHIKDVTRRYCSQFLTVTRKLRADPEWWEETLEPFLPPNNKQDKDEDQQLVETLCNRPLPSTMSEIKNHPLYVIKPHLLKYEAIYPPDSAPVGYLRGEPIYSRDCVFVLHNREKWMKEARVVREGEKAYKMVKSRPKWDKINRRIIKTEELPLVEVFGHWQTEQFVPPTACDGKVPRNEYGNVELFQPSMLPKGTVHLQIPGLNRIARKLDIDCAPALTGFDVHNLGIHPVFDGWIVCKEFKETLLAAWDEEQENIRKREQEKREKRIYGNWKKLIKGMLIRERIRIKYALK